MDWNLAQKSSIFFFFFNNRDLLDCFEDQYTDIWLLRNSEQICSLFLVTLQVHTGCIQGSNLLLSDFLSLILQINVKCIAVVWHMQLYITAYRGIMYACVPESHFRIFWMGEGYNQIKQVRSDN